MFDLAQNVGRRHFRIAADLVGNDQRFGRPGKQVDADPAEQLPLGLGDKGIARADQNIDRIDALRADRHRADRLNTAQRIDRIGAGQRLRRDDRARRLALERRCARDHPVDPGNFGGDHRHVRRSEQRILAARHVAAGGIDRHVLVAQHHAGHRFDFDILHAVALNLREIAHLSLGEFDILALLRAQAVDCGIDFGLAQPVIIAIPAIELDAHLAQRRIAALLDVGQRGFDDIAHFAIGSRLHVGIRTALEILGHCKILPWTRCCKRLWHGRACRHHRIVSMAVYRLNAFARAWRMRLGPA